MYILVEYGLAITNRNEMLSAKDDCFTWNNRTKDIREVLFHVKHLSASGGTPIIPAPCDPVIGNC